MREKKNDLGELNSFSHFIFERHFNIDLKKKFMHSMIQCNQLTKANANKMELQWNTINFEHSRGKSFEKQLQIVIVLLSYKWRIAL